MHMAKFSIKVNGKSLIVEAEPDTPLLWVLRDELGLTGTKYGCGKGLCGACTVHLEGEAIRSCQLRIADLGKGQVTTIEGISGETLHPVQQAWVEADVPQCGYCQSGQIMSAIAFLKRTPRPDDTAIDENMAGNICRCGTYTRIRAAIKMAANHIAVKP